MVIDKYYLQLGQGKKEEITPEALKDPAAFIKCLCENIKNELWRLISIYDIAPELTLEPEPERLIFMDIAEKCKHAPEWDFCVLLAYLYYYFAEDSLNDETGDINQHLFNAIIEDIKSRETTTAYDILSILQDIGEGKENNLQLRKLNFNGCREWLALPESGRLVKMCEEIRERLKLSDDIPPFYVLLTAYTIQAYYNYCVYQGLEDETDILLYWLFEQIKQEKAIKGDYTEPITTKGILSQADRSGATKSNQYIKYTREQENRRKGAPLLFTAYKIGEAMRPTIGREKQPERKKGKKGETRPDYKTGETLEEIINALQDIMPIIETPNTTPQGVTASKAWQLVKDHLRCRIIEIDNKKLWDIVPGAGTDNKYIFIDADLLQIPGITEALKNASRASAYYYIALRITEGRRAGKAHINIKKTDLYYLCGYETKPERTQRYFINQVENMLEKLEAAHKIGKEKPDKEQICITIKRTGQSKLYTSHT